MQIDDRSGGALRRRVRRTLLAAPVVALLFVPLYAGAEPTLLGLPFFHAYLFGWAALTPALLAAVHLLLRPGTPGGPA